MKKTYLQSDCNLNKRQDYTTAQAFATSWNHVFSCTPYTDEQVVEWFAPITSFEMVDKTVLEMGCGSGGLLHYVARQNPTRCVGIDLGDSVKAAQKCLQQFSTVSILQDDLVDPHLIKGQRFDLVYSIGVLHHLKDPEQGFCSVLKHTKAGGAFHCWVYAKEGNFLVRLLVEPLRRFTSFLPWWLTKYAFALPLTIPFYCYSQVCNLLNSFFNSAKLKKILPMFTYMLWIAKRSFFFHHHVAFDQLVTPQTTFLAKSTIEDWLQNSTIDPSSIYCIFRNENGWKFGGKIRSSCE